MPVAEVKEYLKAWGKDKDVMEFTASSATVALAAQALGVDEARIAKSLAFRAVPNAVWDESAVNLPVIMVVCAGDAKIDNARFKQCFGIKAKMLAPEEALAATGHAVGGVCPFAINNPNAQIYLDDSMKRFDTVFPACGSASSAIEMTCAELFECSRAIKWVDVCKLPQ